MKKRLPLIAIVAFPLLFLACMSVASEKEAPSNRDFTHTINHGGEAREFDVHLPPGYNVATPMPLLIGMHGGGGNRQGFRDYSKLDQHCDAAGYIVVYPDGAGKAFQTKDGPLKITSWNAGGCCPPAVENNVDDVGFLRKMLDFIENNYKVDPKRIYATGHSNGGMMSYRLACEMPNRIAAIAAVGAPPPPNCPIAIPPAKRPSSSSTASTTPAPSTVAAIAGAATRNSSGRPIPCFRP